MATVRVRRVYDQAEPADGTRVLVDRIWPRGLRRNDAEFDQWCKDVAPSTALRTWYGHDPDKFAEFAARYRTELADGPAGAALAELAGLTEGSSASSLTLLTATKDVPHSHATVLAAVLAEMLRDGA